MNILLSILLFPVISACIVAFLGNSKLAKIIALGSSLISALLTISLLNSFISDASMQFVIDYPWLESMGIHFKAGVDGISIPFVLLTNFLIPLIIFSGFNYEYKNQGALYGLILFMQAGLLVVFTALDGFLFYIGWEAALIPIYFICGLWGGGDRIRINLKFFIYTIAGSLIMLTAIIFLYLQTPEKTFAIDAFYRLNLDPVTQGWIFWAFFLAFAVKMPIFPFHTWQPDTYTEAPTIGTMLLAGIMLKMGIYGAIRWLIPVSPLGFSEWGQTVMILSIIGIVYASIIAFMQKDIKRLIAYSSIAHVGLIATGVFAWNLQGLQGALIQSISHGINVVGLFFIADIIIRRLNTRNITEMGGIAKVAPTFSIVFLIVLLGAVALPMTNGFIGEFLLLIGISNYAIILAAIAGLTMIFAAVYLLRMYQAIMLGKTNERTIQFMDIKKIETVILVLICVLVLGIGIYPKPILNLSEAAVSNLIEQVNQKILVK